MSMMSQFKARQHSIERVTVAVVDIAGGKRCADRFQLIAG
jgi:hypothetical protein